jgi:hypothetical protein
VGSSGAHVVALGIMGLLVLSDTLTMLFTLLNPEGYWDHRKIEGGEALERLLPLYGLELLSELAALTVILISRGRGGRPSDYREEDFVEWSGG